VDDLERLERLARDLRAAAEEALARAREAIAAGRGAEAKNLAVTAGVAVDKCAELARQVQAAREHQGRLAERDGRLLVEITEKAWAAIGVPLRGPATRVLAALIRQAQAGHELDAPAADAAVTSTCKPPTASRSSHRRAGSSVWRTQSSIRGLREPGLAHGRPWRAPPSGELRWTGGVRPSILASRVVSVRKAAPPRTRVSRATAMSSTGGGSVSVSLPAKPKSGRLESKTEVGLGRASLER
jgi:hypothetical protein